MTKYAANTVACEIREALKQQAHERKHKELGDCMVKRKKPAAVEILKSLRDDVKELEFEKVSGDGHTILVSKPEVLQLIADWIEYCLNPQ